MRRSLTRAAEAGPFISYTMQTLRRVTLRHLLPCLLFLVTLHASAQSDPALKLDPAFRSLLLQKDTDPEKRSLSSRKYLVPTPGFLGRQASTERRYECIVYTSQSQQLRDSGIVVHSRLPQFVTAWITLEQMEKMVRWPFVKFIEAPHEEKLTNDIAVARSGAALLHAGRLNGTAYKGKGVIIAIFDTGIDWKHPDFHKPGLPAQSRILRLWDQTLTAGGGEAPPAGFSYGVEYTREHISDEIDGSPRHFVRANDINGHGTHVAGIAAGNGLALPGAKYAGMAPEADIVVIKGGNTTFPISRIIDALQYLRELSVSLNRPVVMNLSLGSLFGPHDGTRAHEIAIDNFATSGPGRVVVASAGNFNGMRVHNQLILPPQGQGSVTFTVPSSSQGSDVLEYRVYSNGPEPVVAKITAPNGDTVVVGPDNWNSGTVMADEFRVGLDNFVDFANGDRYVNFYLARNLFNGADPAGNWTLTLYNASQSALKMDGWLHYTNAAFSSTVLQGGDDRMLVGTPGNATHALTVGSYVGQIRWQSASGIETYFSDARQDGISSFSAEGPRRDMVLKPEITAHGQLVVSALSSDAGYTSDHWSVIVPNLYLGNQGTSMASPVVSGAAALLLQARPELTAIAIKQLITSAANTDALTNIPFPVPNPVWGYGRLDVYKAASTLVGCGPALRNTLQYDPASTGAEDAASVLQQEHLALRLTPASRAKLGGVLVHTSLSVTHLIAQVRASRNGVPDTVMGTVDVPASRLGEMAWNYIDLSELQLTLHAGTDYFIVLSRKAGSTGEWSVRRSLSSGFNRSYVSATGSGGWTVQAYDYRIRPIIYYNAQEAGTLAPSTTVDRRHINSGHLFLTQDCKTIALVRPHGPLPVGDTVTARVWVRPFVQLFAGRPFVARHFEILPRLNSSTATGKVTLYFTQAEFDDFNAHAGSTQNLPTGPNDEVGKGNLRVVLLEGSSADGSGLPHSYNQLPVAIDISDSNIVWNADAARWEITFVTAGFGAFFVQTEQSILPIHLLYFTGQVKGYTNILQWKADCISTGNVQFELQRSKDGSRFNTIGEVSATEAQCSQQLSYRDETPLPGNNFYRLKMKEQTGRQHFSPVILLQQGKSLQSTLFPTQVWYNATVHVFFTGARGTLLVFDDAGRQVYQRSLRNGSQSFSWPQSAAGIYFYRILHEGKTEASGRIVVK